MTIKFHISDFFSKLFPEVDSTNHDVVKQKLKEFYYPIQVKIEINGDKIQVEFKDDLSGTKSIDFYKATDLCVKKRYLREFGSSL